jgi:hypothetical protein
MSDEVATAMAKYYAADKARTEARKVLEAALAAEARRSREERDDLRKEAACYIGDVHPFVTAVQKVVADFFNLTVAGRARATLSTRSAWYRIAGRSIRATHKT